MKVSKGVLIGGSLLKEKYQLPLPGPPPTDLCGS